MRARKRAGENESARPSDRAIPSVANDRASALKRERTVPSLGAGRSDSIPCQRQGSLGTQSLLCAVVLLMIGCCRISSGGRVAVTQVPFPGEWGLSLRVSNCRNRGVGSQAEFSMRSGRVRRNKSEAFCHSAEPKAPGPAHMCSTDARSAQGSRACPPGPAGGASGRPRLSRRLPRTRGQAGVVGRIGQSGRNGGSGGPLSPGGPSE